MSTISLYETDQSVVNFTKMYFPPCKDCKLLQHPRGPCSIALSIYASSTNIYVSRHGHRLIHPAAAANSRAYQPITIYGLELAQIQRYLAEPRGGEDRAESARAICTRSTTPWPSRSPSTVCSRLSAIQSILRPGMLTKKKRVSDRMECSTWWRCLGKFGILKDNRNFCWLGNSCQNYLLTMHP